MGLSYGVHSNLSINQIKHFMEHLKSGRIVDHATLGATVTSRYDGAVIIDGSFVLKARAHAAEQNLETQRLQRELGELGEHRARLRFREDGDDFAGLDRALAKHVLESLDPLAFDAFDEHGAMVASVAP